MGLFMCPATEDARSANNTETSCIHCLPHMPSFQSQLEYRRYGNYGNHIPLYLGQIFCVYGNVIVD